MFRSLSITGVLLAASAATAGTFAPTPYLVDAGVDALTRGATRSLVDRDLFGSPWATVVVGHVDIHDRFPYLESRYFQVVSDPAWNRLVLGEAGRDLAAYDGAGSTFGSLREPRGLATDGHDRVFVADTGNDRVLVFRAVTEFDELKLEPLASIDGLSAPWDVACSDGGTPLDDADDRLYVADTGRNEVVRFSLAGGRATRTGSVGGLGSGIGRFAGPLALAVGRDGSAATDDVYVADAHNGRLVHLRDDGNGLAWVGERAHELGAIGSLDTDRWGNLYAAAAGAGAVVKYNARLEPVARLADGVTRPRAFHVPFVTVTDHRTGRVERVGEGRGVVVEEWSDDSGLRLLGLGVELAEPMLRAGNEGVEVTLTDNADVTVEIVDPASGTVVGRQAVGVLAAGRQVVALPEAGDQAGWPAGRYRLRLTATSTYADGGAVQLALEADLAAGGTGQVPAQLALLGNAPNPFNPTTTIAFTIPAGATGEHQLNVYDPRGRLVRQLGRGPLAAGRHEATWDGRDDAGAPVGAGVYLYRLEHGDRRLTGKMVLVK
ncbi:MAG: T9SS type A sorting domain-containing protein [bacterium]|nr:T9SS type A sorting domain-containing protein [bacterium]